VSPTLLYVQQGIDRFGRKVRGGGQVWLTDGRFTCLLTEEREQMLTSQCHGGSRDRTLLLSLSNAGTFLITKLMLPSK